MSSHSYPVSNKILSILIKNSGKLDSFALFNKTKVSFSEFTSSIRSLVSSGDISENDYVICITNQGKLRLFSVTGAKGGVTKYWREIPSEYLCEKVSLCDPYIPSLELLDKNTFIITDD